MARWLAVVSMIAIAVQGGIAQGFPGTATISHLLCVIIRVLISPHSCTRALLQQQAESSGSEAGETCREMAVNFAFVVSLFIPAGFFNAS
jgi:hypothetical protein